MIKSHFFLRNLFAFALTIAVGLASVQNVHAQPSGARGTDFIYRVMSNDTLIDLSQTYTTTPQNWSQLQTLNQVADPYKLSIGRYLRIPFELIPEQPSSARVSHLSGQATVNGKPLALNDMVSEGDQLATTANGYITLLLEDNSVSTVTANSTMRVQRLRTFKGTGLLDAVFTMEQGGVESAVAPKSTGVGRFEIRTPMSITGVRGTRLRVHSSVQGISTEVLEGAAQQGSGAFSDPTIAQGQGAATDASGQFLGVRQLLPAPVLEPMQRGGQGWVMRMAPVDGAVAYTALVALDAAGNELVSSQTFTQPEVSFNAPGPGNYYVFVRAIDHQNVMGQDASQQFSGQSVLRSTNGLPVASGLGSFVTLTQY